MYVRVTASISKSLQLLTSDISLIDSLVAVEVRPTLMNRLISLILSSNSGARMHLARKLLLRLSDVIVA